MNDECGMTDRNASYRTAAGNRKARVQTFQIVRDLMPRKYSAAEPNVE
jgi:hypothetical protein